MALNADNVMSAYRPYGHHWIDSAIQESLLPGSPWQLIYDKLSQVLAKRIQPELSDHDKRAAIFEMLGPGFLQKYLSKWTWDKPMQDVISPDEKRLTTQATQLLLKDKLDQAATDCGYLVSKKKTDTSSSLTFSSPAPVQVPEEVIDTITQVDAIFRAGMQRYLVQEGMKAPPSSKSTKEQLTHLHEVNQDHRANNSAQPTNHDVNPNHQASSPLQGDIPNCWGKTSDLLGSSVCAILRRDPSRLDEVCRKLMGRQLPGSLRYKIWNEMMLRNYKEMQKGEKRSEWFLRQNFARTVMRGKAELGITMTTNSPINGLLQTAVQEKYSSTPCLLKHRGQGSFTKHVQEALNIVYVFDRSYQPYYIHWLYPLQLALMEKTQANTQGPDDVPYELALQLYLLRSHTFPSWSQILAVAQNVMLTIERKDPEFFNHLMQCSKTNVKLDPKDFLVHQIHEEQQKTSSIQDDAVTMVTGSDEDRQMLSSPVMFLRKWLGEGFVGVCDTQAVLFIWDQCFMSDWSSEVLSKLCLSLIMLLRKNFMEMAQDYHVMKQIFSSEPCRLYTLDIQKAFQHLQSEGSLTDIPSLNRRPLVRTERIPPSPSMTLDPCHYAQLLHSSPIDLTNIQPSPIPVHASTITPIATPTPISIPPTSITPPITKATPSATPPPTNEATPSEVAPPTIKATSSEAAPPHHQSQSSNTGEPIDKPSSGSVVLGSDSSLQEEGKDGSEDSSGRDEEPVWVTFKPATHLPASPAPKKGFDLYIDCVRFIPDNATIVKVTARFINGSQNMTSDLCALPDMTSLARCPTFMYRARFEGETNQLLELMVWTVDGYTHQLVVIGTCLINVYNRRTKKLNIGGHQLRLRSGYPASRQPILAQSLDHLPPIPGCTILLRLLPHSEEFIEASPYSSGLYQSDACKPTESENNVIGYYKAKLNWIKTVRDAAIDLARSGDYNESSATPDDEHDPETSISQEQADTWSKIPREELETWMMNRLQTKHHPSEGLPPLLEIDRCIDYERDTGVAIKIRTAFGLQAENCYSIVLSRLLPGPKASSQMSDSGDGTSQSGSLLTKEMDLDSRMNAPRWNDKAKILRPMYDEQSVLLLQFFGLEVIYNIDPSGRTKGVVKARNSKAGLSLDKSSYQGWGLLPIFDRNCVIQGTFIIPIFQNNNDKPYLKGIMDATSLESWMRVSVEKKLIKVHPNHPSAIVSMWDAHFYQGQHTPLPRRDYFLHLAGDFNKFSAASQDKTSHPLNQIVLRSLPSAVQSEGTSGQKYLKEKQNFEQSLHSIATDLVEDALLTTGQAPLTS